MGIGLVAKNHLQLLKTMFFTTNNFENFDLKTPNLLYSLIFLMSFACHSDVICMRSYFTYIYSYAIRMSLVCIPMSLACTRTSSVCHSYVLICHPYVTRMYSYVIRMSLVCTRMSSVCHLYVLVRHAYVTRMYSYVIRMSLVCGFTMNRVSVLFFKKVTFA